jgi:hypothetical protein
MHTIAISCGTHVIIFSDGNFRLEKSRKRKPPSLSLSRLVFFFPFLINATNLLLQTLLLLLLLVFKLSSTCRYLPAHCRDDLRLLRCHLIAILCLLGCCFRR